MNIKKLVNNNVSAILINDFGITNKSQSKAIAKNVLLELKKEGLAPKQIKAQLLNGDTSALTQAVNKVIASGKAPWVPNVNFKDSRQEMIFKLIRGDIPNWKELTSDKKLLSAVVLLKNLTIMEEARGLVNDILIDMFQQLDGQELSPQENIHMEVMISDLLSLYPYLRPNQGDKLQVPVQINGGWKLIEYDVDKITLTPSWMGSPLVAYGLSAVDAPPLLLFKGTTYPTDEGFLLSIITDFNPVASVGSYAYKIGKKKIATWLQDHTTEENKAIIFGKSLGGALAWRTALQFPDYVQKSMCLAAPGLSLRDLKKLKSLRKRGNLPEINIFSQKNDPVAYIDHIAKKGVNYYQVLGEKSKKGVIAHALMNSTQDQSVILNKKHRGISLKRVTLSGMRHVGSFVAFPPLVFTHASISLVKRILS